MWFLFVLKSYLKHDIYRSVFSYLKSECAARGKIVLLFRRAKSFNISRYLPINFTMALLYIVYIEMTSHASLLKARLFNFDPILGLDQYTSPGVVLPNEQNKAIRLANLLMRYWSLRLCSSVGLVSCWLNRIQCSSYLFLACSLVFFCFPCHYSVANEVSLRRKSSPPPQ